MYKHMHVYSLGVWVITVCVSGSYEESEAEWIQRLREDIEEEGNESMLL
jgi:hypothetical protein